MYESEFEKNLYQQRRDKLRQIAELGMANGLKYDEATYPNSYSATHTIPELRAAYDSLTAEQLESAPSPINVSIAGRIMAIRVQGKAGFAQLQQGGQRFQIYVRKDDAGENAFALYKLLDLGDHIGVRGHLFRTRTGELTVHVEPVDNRTRNYLPRKAMLALPTNTTASKTPEATLLRQRYVDLFMNTGDNQSASALAATISLDNHLAPNGKRHPERKGCSRRVRGTPTIRPPQAPPTLTTEAYWLNPETPNVREVASSKQAAALLRAIRKFFDRRGYLESRNPHDASGRGRCSRAALHHAPQRARPRPLPSAHRP